MSLARRLRWTCRGLRHVALRHHDSICYAPAWLASVWSNSSPLERHQPWLTFPATAWLERMLSPNMRVFEFGSGGSSLFFSQRVAEVVSTEHDPEWHARVLAELRAEHRENCQLLLVPQTPAADGPQDVYLGEQRVKTGGRFEQYARAIDAFPDHSFDIVMVDGLARRACVQHALPKVKPGGYLILDNSEWPEFEPIHALLSLYPSQHFFALGPFGDRPWETTVWQIPESTPLAAAA